MKITIEVGDYKFVAKVQNDTEATLIREYTVISKDPFNTYAISTVNLPREIRRAMGDHGISIPKEG